MDDNSVFELLVFGKVNYSRDGGTRNENPQVDLSAEQLDQPGCSWQYTSHAGARRLIQALIKLNCSTESSDEERDENDGKDTSITFSTVNEWEDSNAHTSNKDTESLTGTRKRIGPANCTNCTTPTAGTTS